MTSSKGKLFPSKILFHFLLVKFYFLLLLSSIHSLKKEKILSGKWIEDENEKLEINFFRKEHEDGMFIKLFWN